MNFYENQEFWIFKLKLLIFLQVFYIFIYFFLVIYLTLLLAA
jgi:hypothetical protein